MVALHTSAPPCSLLSGVSVPYSPKCLEAEFSEVRVSGVLGTPPLARNLYAFSRPSLPDIHPLTVASHNVSLVSVDGISAGAATHHVLDGRDVPRLEDILATPPVVAIHRGVAGSADKVVPSNATVDQVCAQVV